MTYTIKWVGTAPGNYHPGRNGYKPVAIVNHIMCGTMAGTDAWFNDRRASVSAHYGVSRKGEIHQYVKDEDTAYAVGHLDHPTWSLINKYPINPNDWTISIEHEGYPEDGLTEPQYQATLWLHKYLIAKHGIPVDREHIVGHCVLDTVNRKDCPGDKFPWDRLFKDLGVNTPAPKAVSHPTLKFGDKGDDVKLLQHLLGVKPEDGVFGPVTLNAVKKFQQSHGLAVDGIVGQQTWSKLLG
jgi:N-acetyl-anhydromuramyl-L-alanine amidase AmpD